MNTTILLGRVTADIELRQTSSGKSVVNFSLAVKRPYTKDTTDFFTIIAFEKTAETLSKYVRKGTMIAIRGSLQTRKYTDKNNNERTATEVVAQEFFFCESKANGTTDTRAESNHSSQSEFSSQSYIPSAYTAPQNFEAVEVDQDLPF